MPISVRRMQPWGSLVDRRRSLWQQLHIDGPLLFGLLVMCAAGIMVLFSASGQDQAVILRQVVRLGVGFAAMAAIAQIPPQQLARWSLGIYLVGVLLLIAVLVFGHIGKGAQRWLDLGLFRFQPSEIMKLAVPMTVAWYLDERPLPPNLRRVAIALLLVILPTALVIKQPDLGTALLIAGAGLLVLFLAGISWRYIGSAVLMVIVSAALLWYPMHDYQRQRVLTMLVLSRHNRKP